MTPGKALSATASGDRSFIPGIERPDTAALLAPLPAASAPPVPPVKKRLKIWQIPSGWLCSVVGTCLTASDVERIARRCGLAFPNDVQTYAIHGCMVARDRARPGGPRDHQDLGRQARRHPAQGRRGTGLGSSGGIVG
jgi:hypothetical protein